MNMNMPITAPSSQPPPAAKDAESEEGRQQQQQPADEETPHKGSSDRNRCSSLSGPRDNSLHSARDGDSHSPAAVAGPDDQTTTVHIHIHPAGPQHDKGGGVCSACCDSMSDALEDTAPLHRISNLNAFPDDEEEEEDDPGSNRQQRHSVTVEYINLPSNHGQELQTEVTGVLVELPEDLLGSGDDPPPPYTLVRGRRMRFLQQRMHGHHHHHHLPADVGDLYRLQQPDGHHLGSMVAVMSQQQQESLGGDDGKGCCRGLVLPESLNVRWFIVIIVFIALCCMVVGIVLGALKGANEFTGDDSLTIALLLIGVGIILMAVSGAAWKLTAKQGSATSLRNMLGFGSIRATSPPLRSFRRASTGPFSAYILRNSFGRNCPGHYHEFHFRPPPPSYHATVSDSTHGGRTLLDHAQNTSHNRTPPPIYTPINRARAGADPPLTRNPLPILNQLNGAGTVYQHHPTRTHHLPALAAVPSHHQRSAPPSYRFRPAAVADPAIMPVNAGGAPEQLVSMGQINAMFNENYNSSSVEGCVNVIGRQQQRRDLDGPHQSTSGLRRGGRGGGDPSRSNPKSAQANGRNMELLAQL